MAVAVLLSAPTPSPALADPPVLPAPAPSPAEDSALVWNRAASLTDRNAAATRLLASPLAESRTMVAEFITFTPGGVPTVEPDSPSAGAVMLAAIAAESNAPVWLLEPLSAALSSDVAATPERRRLLVQALGSIRSRDAVRILIDLARPAPGVSSTPSAPSPLDAIFPALIRLTGHAEFGSDLNRWALWYGTMQWLPEAEWRRTLAESLARRADTLLTERDRVVSRLIETLRQRYLSLDAIEERSNMLADLMRDPQPEVRSMALLTAKQELANARQLDPVIGRAAAERLQEPSVPVRRAAAELISILGGEEDAGKVAAALIAETDATVAALLLKFTARAPVKELTPVLIAWFEAGPPAAQAACDALESAFRAGFLTDAQFRLRVVEVLRRWDQRIGELPPSALRLTWSLGDDSDRQRLAARLRDSSPERRNSVAEALANEAGVLDVLLDAARSDPTLSLAAARSIVRFRHTQAGFRELIGLQGLDPDARQEFLIALSASLSHPDLIGVAIRTPDIELREAMLARLATEPLEDQVAQSVDPGDLGMGSPWESSWAKRSQNPFVISGLLMLCDARLALKQPAGALAALDALLPASKTLESTEYNQRRAKTLLWLDRIDDARKLDVSPETWLDGLEYCLALPHAKEVVAAFEERFPTPRAELIDSRFADLRGRIKD